MALALRHVWRLGAAVACLTVVAACSKTPPPAPTTPQQDFTEDDGGLGDGSGDPGGDPGGTGGSDLPADVSLLSMRGDPEEIEAFDTWLGLLPHRHKVVIAGNHDFLFEQSPRQARRLLKSAEYLQDSGLTIEGVRIWGSPWQPRRRANRLCPGRAPRFCGTRTACPTYLRVTRAACFSRSAGRKCRVTAI